MPEPKNARGTPVCDLLTDAQITELGLQPETEQAANTESNTPTCSWLLVADDLDSAALGVRFNLQNPPLAELYLARATFDPFEPMTVAGHPAVRADLPSQRGCVIFVAVADDQLLSTSGTTITEQQPDPCERSRRMAEMVLSNLPPKT